MPYGLTKKGDVHVRVHTCKGWVLKLEGYFLGDWVHSLRNLHSEPWVVKHAHKIPRGFVGLLIDIKMSVYNWFCDVFCYVEVAFFQPVCCVLRPIL